MRRKAYVEGQFYPGRADELKKMIEGLMDPRSDRKRALSVVSPHAGYVYSGSVAAAVFSSVEIPDTAVILGPAHRDIGPLFAIQREGSWLTPLGETPVETVLADSILENCALVEDDPKAHEKEHSLEVQVPFLQYLKGDVSIVPICVSSEASLEDLEKLGKAVSLSIRRLPGRKILIVASTDMSHYVSHEEAGKRDDLALKQILKLDPRGLFRTVLEKNISMCGFQPTTAALAAAKELGAEKAEVILYRTSGDITGDRRLVVGYAGIRIL